MRELTANHRESAGRSTVPSAAPGWLVFFSLSLLLYALTASRGAQWQDSGYHILRVVTGESVNPLGLALTHPLHHWLGRLAAALNLCEPALAVTLISALGGAFAVANVYGCVIALTSHRWAAGLSAASLALANTFWQLSTVAETYTLTAALLSAECWCLVAFIKSCTIHDRRETPDHSDRLVSARGPDSTNCQVPDSLRSSVPPCLCAFSGLFFLNGLGLANHNLALLTTPVLALVACMALQRRWVSPGNVALAAALWLMGSLPYTGLVVVEGMRGADWAATMRSALFGNAYEKDVLNTSVSGSRLLINTAFILLNFPNLLLPVAACGLFASRRAGVPAPARCALSAALLIHAVFALRYSVVDQHYFFLPTYVLLALFGGIGFAHLLGPCTLYVGNASDRAATENEGANLIPKRRRRGLTIAAASLLALTPILYVFAPDLARRFDVLGFVERHKPYRDDYVYLFTPWTVVERSADRMSREAVHLAGDDGVILVEDRMAEFAIRYRALRDEKTGVHIVRELDPKAFLLAVEEGRPFVLVPRNAEKPLTLPLGGSWRRSGDLYLFQRDSGAGSPPQ